MSKLYKTSLIFTITFKCITSAEAELVIFEMKRTSHTPCGRKNQTFERLREEEISNFPFYWILAISHTGYFALDVFIIPKPNSIDFEIKFVWFRKKHPLVWTISARLTCSFQWFFLVKSFQNFLFFFTENINLSLRWKIKWIPMTIKWNAQFFWEFHSNVINSTSTLRYSSTRILYFRWLAANENGSSAHCPR